MKKIIIYGLMTFILVVTFTAASCPSGFYDDPETYFCYPPCYDSDAGVTAAIKGTVKGYMESSKTDYCFNDYSLVEYSCCKDNNILWKLSHPPLNYDGSLDACYNGRTWTFVTIDPNGSKICQNGLIGEKPGEITIPIPNPGGDEIFSLFYGWEITERWKDNRNFFEDPLGAIQDAFNDITDIFHDFFSYLPWVVLIILIIILFPYFSSFIKLIIGFFKKIF